MKKIIILKNDAVGDLTHSLQSINNIIKDNVNHDITIFLSDRSKNFSFLIKGNNIQFKVLNYDLTLFEKIKLFLRFFDKSIEKIYILTPKSFYYFLPLFFKKIKFYAICINGYKNYKRPNEYLRKFLYKYVINNRGAIHKRDSTAKIQSELTKISKIYELGHFNFKNKNLFLNDFFIKNYAYFHIKSQIIKKLGWSDEDLLKLFNAILKSYDYIYVTRDIENTIIKKKYNFDYNLIDLKFKKPSVNNSKIYIFDNIEGLDLFNLIDNSKMIIAFHGMMTNLAALNKKDVLDLFFCEIKDYNDYASYRNSFYEFKPQYKNYNFIIPSKNIDKTLKKMSFCLK